ncbi:hypothetical protein A33M_3348 [Rhodovulum sp. PH10]|uniref:hypothetical protein n=1 Tax=Rhodovulum sp. PH10 TaxID=1187851 RepID=UPI00027C293A|nr:hypothetical protein [Rhodovulum sp. PH10]EJW11270.1 hypothetical protein A33M_3348 [Rhodovulum sp. PH10]
MDADERRMRLMEMAVQLTAAAIATPNMQVPLSSGESISVCAEPYRVLRAIYGRLSQEWDAIASAHDDGHD